MTLVAVICQKKCRKCTAIDCNIVRLSPRIIYYIASTDIPRQPDTPYGGVVCGVIMEIQIKISGWRSIKQSSSCGFLQSSLSSARGTSPVGSDSSTMITTKVLNLAKHLSNNHNWPSTYISVCVSLGDLPNCSWTSSDEARVWEPESKCQRRKVIGQHLPLQCPGCWGRSSSPRSSSPRSPRVSCWSSTTSGSWWEGSELWRCCWSWSWSWW